MNCEIGFVFWYRAIIKIKYIDTQRIKDDESLIKILSSTKIFDVELKEYRINQHNNPDPTADK
jgi:hypothetical protein